MGTVCCRPVPHGRRIGLRLQRGADGDLHDSIRQPQAPCDCRGGGPPVLKAAMSPAEWTRRRTCSILQLVELFNDSFQLPNTYESRWLHGTDMNDVNGGHARLSTTSPFPADQEVYYRCSTERGRGHLGATRLVVLMTRTWPLDENQQCVLNVNCVLCKVVFTISS